MIISKEYTIRILAPDGGKCCIYGCLAQGSHSVVILDDRDKCQVHYVDLCELHTLTMIIESLAKQF